MLVSVFNWCWVVVILEVLICYGVRYVCIVSGFCFMLFMLVVVENFVFIYYMYFDECGFGYLVLGLVKVS